MWEVSQFVSRNPRGKAIMSLEEAQTYIMEYNLSTVMEMSEICTEGPGVCFFMNDYLFGHRLLPNNFVPSSTVIPHQVKPRKGLENGWVSNLKEYDFVYRSGHGGMSRPHRITSVEELVEYLNVHYAGEKA